MTVFGDTIKGNESARRRREEKEFFSMREQYTRGMGRSPAGMDFEYPREYPPGYIDERYVEDPERRARSINLPPDEIGPIDPCHGTDRGLTAESRRLRKKICRLEVALTGMTYPPHIVQLRQIIRELENQADEIDAQQTSNPFDGMSGMGGGQVNSLLAGLAVGGILAFAFRR